MCRIRSFLLLAFFNTLALAQSGNEGANTQSIVTLTGSGLTSLPSGTYVTDTAQITQAGSDGISAATTGADGSNSSTTSMQPGTTSIETLLVGGGLGIQTLSVINGTTTIFPSTTQSLSKTTSRTVSSSSAVNTQPCNNYPEFCSRKYSNITEVCAHNSAFVRPGNAASNQALSITQQLNDGIRMIQGETHYVNNTIYSCHTSCDLLNAGTYLSELETVAEWVRDHPYDVLTILIVNSDYVDVGNYTAPIQNSGLAPYLYIPPKVPMHLDDWPTLSEMILSQKRVVIFMDYQANQSAVPYIIDEFSSMWETPFSPQNVSFPCTVQRPPTLKNMTRARDDYMYLANHNLNTEISLAGLEFLIPNTADLNITNAAGNKTGMLGEMAYSCDAMWERPPNFLLVDFYNVGNGSVFEVAAEMNGVTYKRPCCGIAVTSDASPRVLNMLGTWLFSVVGFAMVWFY